MEINNISYFYKNKPIFNDLSLDFKMGKIYGIIGKNGSGKTTLLEILAALRKIDNGNIILNSYSINKDTNINLNKFRLEIGFVSQNPEEEFLADTVYEELELELKFYNYPRTKIYKRIIDSLILVGLNETYINRKIKTLSKNESKKISLAKSLVLNPDILIIDDADIYFSNIKEYYKLLRMLKRRYNKTVIISSNNLEFIHKIVDYIYVLDNGKISLEGNKYDVFTKEKELKKIGLKVPKIIEFENTVLNKKNIKIGYRDEVNDLIKDIYRYVK